MKNLFLKTFLMLVISSSLMGNDTNKEGTPIINSEKVVVNVIDSESSDLFVNAVFNSKDNNLEFETSKIISFIQIYNEEGKLEFQLPIMSNDVSIGKSLFDKGTYKLGFIIEDSGVTQFTEVTMI